MTFSKYHGAGNDFIIVLADRATGAVPFNAADEALVRRLCDRHFGIGADGLIVLRPGALADPAVAFEMLYYNADGRLGSLCGNGARCAVRAALEMGLIEAGEDAEITFRAADGLHGAALLPAGLIRLRMHDAPAPRHEEGLGPADATRTYFLDTGSPHVVVLLPYELETLDLPVEGPTVRHAPRFAPGGVNANFAERLDGRHLRIRTYERGVEDETLACGTGVVATALVAAHHYGITSPVTLHALGGDLQVEFTARPDGSFTDVALIGPAERVFTGEIQL